MNKPNGTPAPVLLREDERLLYFLRSLYRSRGYRSFRMSKFEKYELYAACKDFLVSDRVITFTDTDGELLALKPDVTLSILRAAPFRPGVKHRLCYHENVYRPGPPDGRFREIMQSGLECIGDLDSLDVFEVLSLADESLQLLPAETQLAVSHLGILRSLLNQIPAGEEDRAEILRLIAARSGHGLEALFRTRGFSEAVFRDLCALLDLDCSLDRLPAGLRALGIAPRVEPDVLRELDELASLAEEDGLRARFDFSVLNDTHYYNGIVFRGYARGVAEKVLSGGRYDRLLRRMNMEGGAIGFAVYSGLLEGLRAPAAENDADVLLLYDESTPLQTVLNTERQLRAEGKTVSRQCEENCGLRSGVTLDLRQGGGKDA